MIAFGGEHSSIAVDDGESMTVIMVRDVLERWWEGSGHTVTSVFDRKICTLAQRCACL